MASQTAFEQLQAPLNNGEFRLRPGRIGGGHAYAAQTLRATRLPVCAALSQLTVAMMSCDPALSVSSTVVSTHALMHVCLPVVASSSVCVCVCVCVVCSRSLGITKLHFDSQAELLWVGDETVRHLSEPPAPHCGAAVRSHRCADRWRAPAAVPSPFLSTMHHRCHLRSHRHEPLIISSSTRLPRACRGI